MGQGKRTVPSPRKTLIALRSWARVYTRDVGQYWGSVKDDGAKPKEDGAKPKKDAAKPKTGADRSAVAGSSAHTWCESVLLVSIVGQGKRTLKTT